MVLSFHNDSEYFARLAHGSLDAKGSTMQFKETCAVIDT